MSEMTTGSHMIAVKNEFVEGVLEDVKKHLERYGNIVGIAHEKALREFISKGAEFYQTPKKSRIAVGLETGLGKTTTVAYTLLHALRQGNEKASCVVVPNLKAMAEFNGMLCDIGFPMADVGFVYSSLTPPKGALPVRTPKSEWATKRVLVCCHAQADTSRSHWPILIESNWGARVVWYDEALRYGDTLSWSLGALRKELAFVDIKEVAAAAWFADVIARAEDAQKSGIGTFDLPLRPKSLDRAIDDALASLGWEHRTFSPRTLKKLCNPEITRARVTKSGCFGFAYRLPEDIECLIVLDASHRHSSVSQMDKTVEVIELDQVKQFANVTAIADRGHLSKEGLSKNAVDGLKWLDELKRKFESEGKDFVVICFKEHEEKVRALGIDNVITWGMEKGLNEFKDCQHVVVFGLLRMSNVDTAAKIALTSGDLETSIAGEGKVADTERVLNLYQAASRASCRSVVTDSLGVSQALPCTLYLSGHLNSEEQEFLRKVMPGIKNR
jgi:hypothetical protein